MTQRGTGRATAIKVISDGIDARAGVAAGTVIDPPGPIKAADLADDAGGVLDAVWVQDGSDTLDIEVTVFTAGDPVSWDEEYRIEVVVQTIRTGTSADWEACNLAAENLLGEVVGYLGSGAAGEGPQIIDGGASDPTVDGIEAVLDRIDVAAGWLPDGRGYGCRFAISVLCSDRISLS